MVSEKFDKNQIDQSQCSVVDPELSQGISPFFPNITLFS